MKLPTMWPVSGAGVFRHGAEVPTRETMTPAWGGSADEGDHDSSLEPVHLLS